MLETDSMWNYHSYVFLVEQIDIEMIRKMSYDKNNV